MSHTNEIPPDPLTELAGIISRTKFKGNGSNIDKAIFRLIYEDISDRNLALLISLLTGREFASAMNEVYELGSSPLEAYAYLSDASTQLQDAGYSDWLARQ